MDSNGSRFKPASLLVLLTVAVFLVYSFAAGIIAFILAIFTQPVADLTETLAGDISLPGYLEVGATVLAIAATLPLLKVVCRSQRLRLDFRWPDRREWLLTAKYFLVHFGVLLATGLAVYYSGLLESGEEQIMRQRDLFEGWGLGPTLLLVVVAVPILEEFLFRGFLFAGLRRYGGFWFSFLISGLFFTLLHFSFSASWQENLVIFTVILGLTYFLSRSLEKTSNLAVPIILHGLHNLRVIILTFWLVE
ncbi:CPBP family intramembrane metalloprotease [Candidatus Saccharibacteria bacterium]|nr:CPBP family intramembrane metalloprotease [Candidatus Saccharibacteria bacterium]